MIERFEVFTTTISQIYKSLQRIKMQEMSEFHLKGTHTMCMFELNRNPEGLTITQLSNFCREDKAAISRTISELAAKGLVTSVSSKKYRAPIQLTETGYATAKQIDQMVVDAVAAGGAGFSAEERDIFYKVLTRISDNLNHYLNENTEE